MEAHVAVIAAGILGHAVCGTHLIEGELHPQPGGTGRVGILVHVGGQLGGCTGDGPYSQIIESAIGQAIAVPGGFADITLVPIAI